jgi:sugar O-acyltransferase (sialic acid O-acetyltransferase NeuD family)
MSSAAPRAALQRPALRECDVNGLRGARPLLIFPCNGNGIEALDALGESWHCVGFVDDTPEKQASRCMGQSVRGRSAFNARPDASVLAVPGGPASYRTRRQVIDALRIEPGRFATVIHPSASVSEHARIGRNVLVMAGAVITSNAVIGDHVCILPNSVVHHDAVVGAWSLIGSNVTVAGGVRIGDNCYVASGSSLKDGVQLGDGCLIGMGSTVLYDVEAATTVAGCPARLLQGAAQIANRSM